ncbi:MAG: pyrroline-5-carboxylate reductase [Clostridia bacterium]|nr:pyrroline-5-carboxylate reductase [Clostridia bacterium]
MKIGFIGCGSMGSALAVAAQKAGKGEILLANRTVAKAEALAREIGAAVSTNEEIAATCDYIFLGVKPHVIRDLLVSLSPILADRQDHFVLISMAAGVTIASIEEAAGKNYPLIRIMPNTPASVGAGMIQYCKNSAVTTEDEQDFLAILANAGKVDPLEERLIDAASSLSGCGPAFVCLFMEALADGGVKCGLPRAKAIEYAAQTVIGTGKLLLESGKHPGELKDAVCSPGGSTIAGVAALEEYAFRAAVISAVEAAFDRNQELGKDS